jgi:hypothetical protein
MTGLLKDSVANASQMIAIEKGLLTKRVGKIPPPQLALLLAGIDVVLGR